MKMNSRSSSDASSFAVEACGRRVPAGRSFGRFRACHLKTLSFANTSIPFWLITYGLSWVSWAIPLIFST